jgi:predicted DsbA family dithiol-disulfide isomerase
MSQPVQVTHFVDPGCPWDYSAEPVRVALEQRYGEQLAWRNVQVGLYESAAAAAVAAGGYTTTGQAKSYRVFQERHGMPFCTEERARLAGTWPAARAIKAAERQGKEIGAALLRRLRLAWFVEGRLLDERDALQRLAAEVAGLDLAAFTADMEADVSARALEQDMADARRPSPVALGLEKTSQPAGEPAPRYSTPTYKFTFEGRSAVVPGFQPLAAYEVALHNLHSSIERRPAPDAAGFLRSRPGESYSTVEVAAAVGRSERKASEQLEALLGDGVVSRTVAGARELWSWGPPAFDLRCPTLPHLDERLEQELAA